MKSQFCMKVLFLFSITLFLSHTLHAQAQTWTGGTNAGFMNANNWNPTGTPTANSILTIPNVTRAPIIANNITGLAKRIVIETDASLTVQNGGTLTISGNNNQGANNGIAIETDGLLDIKNGGTVTVDNIYIGINNSGEIQNSGSIIIGQNGPIKGSGFNFDPAGIYMQKGIFHNDVTGVIEIDDCEDMGIRHNGGTFSNDGTITIGAAKKIKAYGIITNKTITNNSTGVIKIVQTDFWALLCTTGGKFENYGELIIGRNGSVKLGVRIILGNLNNYLGGKVTIDNTNEHAVSTQSGGVKNEGTFHIGKYGTIKESGVYLTSGGNSTNKLGGLVTISNTQGPAIYTFGSTFTNEGTLNIGGNGPAQGLLLERNFNNREGGLITIDNTTSDAIRIVDVSGRNVIFNNSGSITIGASGAITGKALAIENTSEFHNLGCVSFLHIASTDSIDNFGTITNEGHTKLAQNQVHHFGNFVNEGVVEDIHGVVSGITNNEIVIAKSVFTCPNINPAFQIGNTQDWQIKGIFTNAAATISAGVYDSASQTFYPSIAQGTHTLYAKLFDPMDSCTSIISWKMSFDTDNTPPTISCKTTSVQLGLDRTYTLTEADLLSSSTDNCGTVNIQSISPSSFDCDEVGQTLTVAVVVNDDNGNTNNCNATITVRDDDNPCCEAAEAACHSSLEVYLDPLGLASIAVSDIDNGSTAACGLQSIAISTSTFDCTSLSISPHQVSLTIIDVNGESDNCTTSVTVKDNENPTINCPNNISQNNEQGLCGAVVTYTISSDDNCSASHSQADATGLTSGDEFPVGITELSYMVIDGSGNTMSCSFTVTIQDAELPVISCPTNITQSNDVGSCDAIVTYTPPVGTDNCSGQTTTLTAGLGSGGAFPIGGTTEAYVVTDASGNTASCSFTVTVNDTEAPSFTCPTSNVVRNADPGVCDHLAVGSDLDPTVSDNCQLQSVVNDYTQSNSLDGVVFPKGKTLVTWTAIDVHGNSSVCSYNVKIRDREAPVFDNCPDDSTIIVPAYSGGSYFTFPALTATDNCNSPNKITISGFPLSGSFCAVGVTPFNWTAADKANNVGHCAFEITVVEQGSPTPTGWSNNTVGNGNGCHTNYNSTTQTLTLQSAGGNVSTATDNFCGVTIPNSTSIIDFRARVTPAGNSYYDQAGIMMRQNLTNNSTHATMLLTGTSVPIMTFRATTGGFPLSTASTAASKPYWLRLYRAGGTITGHVSADGVNWTQVTSYPNLLSSPLYLVLFSTTAGPSGQATFDNISINGNPVRLGVEAMGTELSLKAYPNPFSEHLFIEVENALPGETYHVRLSNLTGQRVYGYETGASAAGTIDQRISMEHLPAGTYLLEVSAGIQRKTIKVRKF